MAQRVFQFAASIPAGTPKSSPVTVPLSLDGWELESLDLEVLPGPSGLLGFYVANNGVQWIPQPAGQFLVWDDVRQSWTFEEQPNASGWAVVGYNGGAWPHTVTVRFHVNYPTQTQAAVGLPTLTVVTSALPAVEAVTL